MGALGGILGISWGSFGRPWGYLGGLLEALGALLGVTWDSLGALGDAFWAVSGAKMCIKSEFGEKHMKIEKQHFAWEG